MLLFALIYSIDLFVRTLPYPLRDPQLTITVISLLVISVSYVLSRTAYYNVGVGLCISHNLAVIYLIALLDTAAASWLYRYTAIPLLLAGIMATSRIASSLIAVNVLFGVAIWTRLETAATADYPVTFIFIATISVLLLIFIRHRDNLEQKRRSALAQSALNYQNLAGQYAAANARLQALMATLDQEMQAAKQAASEARSATEQARRHKTEFVSNISHEIRTPLTGVISIFELLDETELTDLQREYVGIGAESAAKLLAIVENILDFSKLESGRIKLESQPFDLRLLCEDVKETLTPQWSRSRLGFLVDVAPEVPPLVFGDKLRLRQVLLNLVGNAIKFTHEGGVALRLSWLGTRDGHAQIMFEVSDTGIGIAETQMARIFESFVQGDNSSTRRYGGTGLGLAISSEIVRLMGGEIEVTSQVRVGSIFTFTLEMLPAESDIVTAAPPVVAAKVQPGLEKLDRYVLLVEDNPINRAYIAQSLSLFGLLVDQVETGKAALDLVVRRKYDLILMDVHMPIMDGIEVTRRIRASGGANAATPIVAVTASVMPDEQRDYKEAGIDDVLSKPFTKEALHNLIARWLLIST